MNGGANLIDMIHDEAMLEQMAAAKGFPRKMINNIDMATLLKQVQNSQHHLQSKLPSPSSTHSISPPRQSSTPTSMLSTSQQLMLTPVAPSSLPPSTSSSIDSVNKWSAGEEEEWNWKSLFFFRRRVRCRFDCASDKRASNLMGP